MTTTTNNTQKTTNKAASTARAPQGTFLWFELRTPNLEKASRFYGEVLGWKTQSVDMGGQVVTLFANAEKVVANVEARQGPSAFVSYVAVDDVDAAARRVAAAGGKVHGAPVDLPTVGRMVEVEDPEGAVFFLFRGVNDEAGQPRGPGGFLWNELWAHDTRKALAFLTSVLGYGIKEMPMGDITYHVLEKGTQSLAGVMPSMDKSIPSAWLPYVHVVDVDAARARALQLGAQPLGEVMEVPGVGRMALMVDPLGARFAVMTPAR
ncbi:MAG: VOC family protein [Myxococcota bacterium]